MSKLLSTLLGVIIAICVISAVGEGAPAGEVLRFAIIASAALFALGALVATRRPAIPQYMRRGDHRVAQQVDIIRWLLATPWIATVAVVWTAAAILSILSIFSGDSFDPPWFSPRRIARHAWRLWAVFAVSVIGGSLAIDPIEDSNLSVASAALIAFAAVRLATRWMDRADARRRSTTSGRDAKVDRDGTVDTAPRGPFL